MKMSVKNAVPLSNFSIFVSSSLRYFINARKPHPLKNGKGKIISKKEIKIQNRIAQRSEYVLYNEGFNLHIHSIRFLHMNKFYFIQHATVGKKATEDEINKFLNSFKILKE